MKPRDSKQTEATAPEVAVSVAGSGPAAPPKRARTAATDDYDVAGAVDEASARIGWQHPIVKEALAAMLAIARGKDRGRHVGVRMAAYRDLLNRLTHEPVPERRDDAPISWSFQPVDGVTGPGQAPDDDELTTPTEGEP